MATGVRELIESVVVIRTEPDEPVRLKVNGRLAALIGAPAFPDGSLSGVKTVAGEGLATTSILAVKVNKFNNLIATGVRI